MSKLLDWKKEDQSEENLGASSQAPNGGVSDHRCLCGSLMAKITPRGIEIKCRKCKRLQLIPYSLK